MKAPEKGKRQTEHDQRPYVLANQYEVGFVAAEEGIVEPVKVTTSANGTPVLHCCLDIYSNTQHTPDPMQQQSRIEIMQQ